MTDVNEGSTGASSARLPSLRTIHKIAALAACAWLTVLGLTGWALDHHAWRWSHQWTVPTSWTSPAINRLIRGTIIRKIEGDLTSPDRLIAASERGLWLTEDRGQNWRDVAWLDSSGDAASTNPQVYDLVSGPSGDLRGAWIATDDGIWRLADDGTSARPVALRGDQITSLTAGVPGELFGVAAESNLFRVRTDASNKVEWIDLTHVEVSGLPDRVNFGRFVFDLHVGRGFLPQPWSTIINDYGGVAMAVLSVTGILFWWLPRRWRGATHRPEINSRRQILRWLFRAHGPTIGLLGIIPILYLALSGFAVDHIVTFLDSTKDNFVARSYLPPLYAYRNLTHEVSGVVAFPEDPQRYMIASRFGALTSRDGGRRWAVDSSLPQRADGTDAGRMNIFRRAGIIFVGIGGVGQFAQLPGQEGWTQLALPGPNLAITDVSVLGDLLLVKNSRAIYSGSLAEAVGMGKIPLQETNIAFPKLQGTTAFLFLADIHSGHIIHPAFGWANDLVALAALVLVLSGPILWWRRKWL